MISVRSPTATTAPRASARSLLLVALACAAGAVLALVAAARPWAVEVAVRPPPLPELRTARSGGDLYPWLPALAWVGLTGAGALLATRGAVRRLTGGLLLLAGAGLAFGAGVGAAGPGIGGGAGASPAWPVLTGLGGVAMAAAGGAAVLLSRHWPAMSARYDRAAAGRPDRAGRGAGSTPVARSAERPDALWDALDRGEDPTDR